MPKIKRNDLGLPTSNRSGGRYVIPNSVALYIGQFVSIVSGTDAAPTGVEFGIGGYADDRRIFGFVTGFYQAGSGTPIQDGNNIAGTITNATGELPMKYTASSTNGNLTGAREVAEVIAISSSDVMEITTWGASTVAVTRGTTTAEGTTGSSANLGNGMSVNATYPFAVTESTASLTLANLDFLTTKISDKHPRNTKRVYARCVRCHTGWINPEA